MDYMSEYKRWCEKAVLDADLVAELQEMAGDEAKIEDAFYRTLEY